LADIIQFLPVPTLAIDKEKCVIIWNWNIAIEKMMGIPAPRICLARVTTPTRYRFMEIRNRS
jgi:hypothetical protein